MNVGSLGCLLRAILTVAIPPVALVCVLGCSSQGPSTFAGAPAGPQPVVRRLIPGTLGTSESLGNLSKMQIPGLNPHLLLRTCRGEKPEVYLYLEWVVGCCQLGPSTPVMRGLSFS